MDGNTTNEVQDGSKAYPFRTIEQALPPGACPGAASSNSYWLAGHTIYVKKAAVPYQPPAVTQSFYGIIDAYDATTHPTPTPTLVSWPLSVIVPPGLRIVGAGAAWEVPVPDGQEPVIDAREAFLFHADGGVEGSDAFSGAGAVLFEGLSLTRSVAPVGGRNAYFNFVNVGPDIAVRDSMFDNQLAVYSGSASMTVEGCTFGDGTTPSFSVMFYGVLDQADSVYAFRRYPLVVRGNEFRQTTLFEESPTFWVASLPEGGSIPDPSIQWVSVVGNTFQGRGKDLSNDSFGALMLEAPTEVRDNVIAGYQFGMQVCDSLRNNPKKVTYLVDGNRISDCKYGIFYTIRGRAVVTNNLITGCDSGIYTQPAVYYQYLWAANNTFSLNGLAIEATQTAEGAVWNNLFVQNQTALDCYSLGYYELFIDHGYNGFWANTTDYSGGCSAQPTDVIGEDPLLVDGLHLGPGSPMIDRGTPSFGYWDIISRQTLTAASPEVDIDKDTRPILNAWDIGADEHVPPAVHVSSIALAFQKVGKAYKKVNVTVSVADASGLPVAGATVSGTLTGPAGETGLPAALSGVSDAAGNAVMTYQTPNASLARGTYTYCVSDVQGGGYIYDSSANAVTCVSRIY